MNRRSDDVNSVVAGYLDDMAAIQTARPKQWAYEGAAAAVFNLDTPIDELRARPGGLPKIPGLGPSSLRIINEVLEHGHSPTVDRTVDASGRAIDIQRRRGLRQNILSRSVVRRVLANHKLRGPSLAGYRGDFQMHSEWSDGSLPIRDMARACAVRGYEFCAITDHAQNLRIAGGMSQDEVVRQRREIDAINERDPSFRILKGIEANIDEDGTIDVPAEELPAFEMVLAAPHKKLRTEEDQTARLMRVVKTPGVHILAHPRGRVSGSRAGIVADWDAVFAEAATRRVAIEIDGDPARQDLDFVLAARALRAGCLFALDSDAHNAEQLVYAETAIAHARLAAIPSKRIINYWSLDELLQWSAQRQRGAGTKAPANRRHM